MPDLFTAGTGKPPTPAEKALAVVEDREQKYGSPRQNMQNTADFWTVWLRARYGADNVPDLDATDAAMMLALLKQAREAHKQTEDNIVDLIGYAEVYNRSL